MEPGIVLGDGYPVLGPDVRLAPGLMISCLLSPPDGVGDWRDPCLAQAEATSVLPIPAEGLLSTQSWRSCGGHGRGGRGPRPATRSSARPPLPPPGGQNLPFSLFSHCPRTLRSALTCPMTLLLPRTGISPRLLHFSSSGNPIHLSRNISNTASSQKPSQMFPLPCSLAPSFEGPQVLIFSLNNTHLSTMK